MGEKRVTEDDLAEIEAAREEMRDAKYDWWDGEVVSELAAEVRRLRVILEDIAGVYESDWSRGLVGESTATKMRSLTREALEGGDENSDVG